MRAIDTDAVARKAEKGLLLSVCEGEGLEASEDDGVVCDYDRGLESDSFIGDGFGEVDCKENRVILSAGRVERSF